MEIITDAVKQLNIAPTVVVTDATVENICLSKSNLNLESLRDSICHEDLLQFKFLTEDLMNEKRKGVVNSVLASPTSTTDFKLFAILEAATEFSNKPQVLLQILLELLYLTKKYRHLKTFNTCKHQIEASKDWIISPFRRFLFDLCENLVNDDLQYLGRHFWPTTYDAGTITTAEMFFEKLIAEKTISNHDVTMLGTHFRIMGRPDLTSILDEYNRETSFYNLDPVEKSGKCGLAVIFNHHIFDKPGNYINNLDPRVGTQIDEENLKKVWEDFNLEVRVHNDLTKDEVMKYMQYYATSEEGINYKIFVCCILSHGGDGEFYASDRDSVSLSDVLGLFGEKAKYLAGKPKLFFIQACQGDRFQTGYQDTSMMSWNMKGICTDHPMYSNFAHAPFYSDILVGTSTVPGFVSFRDSLKGSLYIEVLTGILEEKGHREDIVSVLTEVNAKLAEIKVEGLQRQMPTIKTQLRKKLRFHRLE